MSIPIDINPIGLDKQYLTFKTTEANSSLKINKIGTVDTSNLYYSKNKQSWILYTINETIYLNPGDDVRFWNHNTTLGTSNNNYLNFVMSGNIQASGNIQSLLNFSLNAPNYSFRKLFQNCSALTKAPNILPAKSIGDYTYGATFSKTSITNCPLIKATSSGTYSCYYMFEQTPITSAIVPNLNTWKVFDSMFYNCSYLNTVEVNFTSWSDNEHREISRDWLVGTPSVGTFIKPTALGRQFGTSRIPTNWTIINK